MAGQEQVALWTILETVLASITPSSRTLSLFMLHAFFLTQYAWLPAAIDQAIHGLQVLLPEKLILAALDLIDREHGTSLHHFSPLMQT